MTRDTPILLDAFSGEGGATKGYMDAGFTVHAVDNDPARLERNPAPVKYLADAVEFIYRNGHKYDVKHGSPTCTGYSIATSSMPKEQRFAKYDRLIGVTREAMQATGGIYVIENVMGAKSELRDPTMLCWSMFHEPGSVTDTDGVSLTGRRHRLFESNVALTAPGPCRHPRAVQVAGWYGGARRDKVEARTIRKGGYVPPSLDVLRELSGLSWASEKGTFLSIPPTYTEYIGKQLMNHLA